KALADRKPDAVTDCAIKLAEGERAVGRKHKAITSDTLFRLAVSAAHDKRDKATLARIGKAAEEAKNEDLIDLVDKTVKLVEAGRKVDAEGAAVERAEPAHRVVYRSMAEEIRAAKSLANRGQLEGLKKQVDGLDPFDPKLKTMLSKQVSDAVDKLPSK